MSDANLPATSDGWTVSARQHGVEAQALHDHKLSSASAAGMAQFLLLHAYWPRRGNKDEFDVHCKNGQWIVQENKEKASRELQNASHVSWRSYINSFGPDFRLLAYQGTFALARYYQHLCTQGKSTASSLSQPKVYFPPQTRSMTRAAAAARGSPSVQPSTPPEVSLDMMDIEGTLGSLSLSPTKIYDPFSTPLTAMTSSGDLDEAEVHQAIEDEQIINTALVGFLNALTLHYPVPSASSSSSALRERARGEWSLYRKPFVVKSPQRSKVFEARVDGILRNRSGRTGAIVEVKPMSRTHDTATSNKIRIQETAQMAAWIATEPPPRQQQPRLSSRSKSKATATKTKMHRRLLVSQDRHQIFLVVASFDDEYIDYVTGQNSSSSVQRSFLEMQEYGPYDVSTGDDMRRLGGIMLAISEQGGIF